MAWENVEKGIMILEWKGDWIRKEDYLKIRMEMRQPRFEIETRPESTPK